MPTPAEHYEKSYAHMAYAEVVSNTEVRGDLLLAAAVEGIQGLLLAFLMSQPAQQDPTTPEPQPAPEPTPEPTP